MLSQGSQVVVDTWAQGRMVDKVRTKPGEARNAAARNESRAVVATWVWGVCIYLPGHDRRGNLGALPGTPTSGFHAIRFALASPYRSPFASHIAFFSLFAILTPSVIFVNSICVFYAICNKVAIANCIASSYNDCRLQ